MSRKNTINDESGSEGYFLEPRCRVCRIDEVREKVNAMLAHGWSYAQIVRAVAGTDPAAKNVTVDSIRNHARRHFPVQDAAKAVNVRRSVPGVLRGRRPAP